MVLSFILIQNRQYVCRQPCAITCVYAMLTYIINQREDAVGEVVCAVQCKSHPFACYCRYTRSHILNGS